MIDTLQLRDNAKQELMQIKDVESGVQYLNKVKAIETWARAEKKDAELQNLVAEQKIRTQRILGEMLKESEVKIHGRNQYNAGSNNVTRQSLSEYGITKNESSTFQRIASLPQDVFENEMASAKDERRIELTTSRVLRAVKKFEVSKKRHAYEDRISEHKENNFSIDIFNTDKKFRVVYADPPWSYNDKCEGGSVQDVGVEKRHYDTMSIQMICDLPIKEITEENSVLFLWVTSPLLEDSFKVINAWGFNYKASFIWDKVKHNMGHYNSVRHEFLLVATKGSATPDNKILFDSVQSIEKTKKHSQKPIEFLKIIDDLYNYGDRIELFAREQKQDWYLWGNEL